MENCKPKASGTCNRGSCITGFLNDDGSCKGNTLENLYSVETNFDCTGGDLGGENHIQVDGATDAKCQELCEANDECVGYTWSALYAIESWCHLKKTMVNCKPVPAGKCGGKNGSWKRTCNTAWRLSKATPPNACDGKFEVSTNTDCGGNDITKIHLAGGDHRTCAAKCEEDSKCVGYTWHGRTSDWSDCWLKHAVANCKPKDAGTCSRGTCFSGVLSNECAAKETESKNNYKIETNYDCIGGDIDHIQIWGNSDARCQELCDDDEKCVGYVWSGKESNESWCHLKHKHINCSPVSAGKCGGNGAWKRTCLTAWKQN